MHFVLRVITVSLRAPQRIKFEGPPDVINIFTGFKEPCVYEENEILKLLDCLQSIKDFQFSFMDCEGNLFADFLACEARKED